MNRIKDILKEKKITMNELAEKIGISRVTLSSQINGTANVASYEKIAEALEVPMWQLFASKKDIIGETEGNFVQCPKCSHEFEIEVKVKAK